jgi:hypothetical protein
LKKDPAMNSAQPQTNPMANTATAVESVGANTKAPVQVSSGPLQSVEMPTLKPAPQMAPRGLGRGLGALLDDTAAAAVSVPRPSAPVPAPKAPKAPKVDPMFSHSLFS